MSRGSGRLEKTIGELFAATKDRALSIADICDHAFGLAGTPATRAQRLSATRAAHRLLRRVRDAKTKSDNLFLQAHENTKAALGREQAGFLAISPLMAPPPRRRPFPAQSPPG